MAGVQAFLGRAPPPRLVWSTMQIAVFGRGNVGGGLADIWERAGHQVTRLGRDGGDVSGADAVLLAVPGEAIREALDRLTGVEGKTVLDATNRIGVEPPEGFAFNAEFVKGEDRRADGEVVQHRACDLVDVALDTGSRLLAQVVV